MPAPKLLELRGIGRFGEAQLNLARVYFDLFSRMIRSHTSPVSEADVDRRRSLFETASGPDPPRLLRVTLAFGRHHDVSFLQGMTATRQRMLGERRVVIADMDE